MRVDHKNGSILLFLHVSAVSVPKIRKTPPVGVSTLRIPNLKSRMYQAPQEEQIADNSQFSSF
jgi:hypothetical protein